MPAKKIPAHYSIENIVRSIAEDNPRGKAHTPRKKRALYEKGLQLLEKSSSLKEILSLSHIRSYAIDGSENFARIGMLPTSLVIVDQRIKDMCALPHWTYIEGKDGNPVKFFGKCPGYDFLPGCPPRSIPIKEVEEKLGRADLFIVLQTRQLAELGADWKFRTLRKLAKDIERALGKGTVVEKYGSGPCYACEKRSCLQGEECASPKKKMCALESMGISVDGLCGDLAQLTGQKSWNLTWVKDYGTSNQTPKTWKYVMALSVKIPS
jgi:predicted metal-binding protein